MEEGDGDEDGLPGYNDEAEDVDVEDDEQFVEQAGKQGAGGRGREAAAVQGVCRPCQCRGSAGAAAAEAGQDRTGCSCTPPPACLPEFVQ